MITYQTCCRVTSLPEIIPPEPFYMDIESPVEPGFEDVNIVVSPSGVGTWTAISNVPVANFWIDASANNTQITKMRVRKCTGTTNMYHTFVNNNGTTLLSSLTDVIFDQSADTSTVTNMTQMFANASLTSVNIDYLDTSSVTSLNSMFVGTSLLASLNMSSFVTTNVTDMGSMFASGGPALVDISNFNIDSLTSMLSMFNGNADTRSILMPLSMTTDTGSARIDMRDTFRDATVVECISRINTLIAAGTTYMFLRMGSATTSGATTSPNAGEQTTISGALDNWVSTVACPI